ncbi:MAG: sugar ABC transporter ATP-binding protein [Candidatus Eremiobacter antarcticus]|nr:sugar ABC transporter ATP-binding protein [Candidatus Eremiobacteraeota bacterium]PZR60281.1 MAG: sugar ABC transporter ATP-binding protein [Candidatus Eremiobacter sp. RRmetagenome_bin22]
MVSAAPAQALAPILRARAISKRFGNVIALQDVDFEAYAGDIVALIGDNGAGKSTLIKIISGAILPDSGTLAMRGSPVYFHNPRDARDAGIETAYQDLALAPDLDIPANLFLAREIVRPGLLGRLDFFDRRAMRERAEEHLRDFGIKVGSMEQRVDTLSGGQRQSIAVARTVFWGSALIIMDEPTAALGVAQSALVLDLMRKVRDAGTAVVFISHNLPQVFEAADRIAVMRHGRRVGTLDPRTATMDQAVSLMTGATTLESVSQPRSSQQNRGGNIPPS